MGGRMIWFVLPVAAAAIAWWLHASAPAICRNCGGRAVFCTFPFRCAARRQGLVREARAEDESEELPPPSEEQL